MMCGWTLTFVRVTFFSEFAGEVRDVLVDVGGQPLPIFREALHCIDVFATRAGVIVLVTFAILEPDANGRGGDRVIAHTGTRLSDRGTACAPKASWPTFEA